MSINRTKYELQHILRGKSKVSFGEPIQTISRYLTKSKTTSSLAQTKQHNKHEETKVLKEYITSANLWNHSINFNLFLSQGAEQRVFIQNENKVLKLNDTIYYLSWVDYFHNLLLNNYFFPDTSYELKGFYLSEENILFALVEQNYIEANQRTDLNKVKEFLKINGFEN